MKIVLDKPLFKLVLKIVCSTLCLLSIKIEAQNSENVNVDSLLNILPHLNDDTNKLNTLDILAYVLPNGKWEKYNADLEELSESLLSHPDEEVRIAAKKCLATAINNWGFSKDINGKQEEAIQLYLKSLQLRREINHQEGIAQSLNNLGALYQTMGNINLAISYFEQSLKIRETIGEQKGIAESYNNLGFLYDNLGNYIKALNFHQKSYALRAKINDALGMSGSLINIGNIYSNNLNDYQKAIDYWRKSLKYSNSDNGKSNKAHALNNIGVAYRKMAEMQKKKIWYNY